MIGGFLGEKKLNTVEVTPQVDSYDSFVAGFQGNTTPLENLTRLFQEKVVYSDAPKISAEEANKLYTNVEKKFDRPINSEFARILDEDALKKKQNQEIVARGSFGWGLAGMFASEALDPVNIGADLAGVGIVNSVMRTKSAIKGMSMLTEGAQKALTSNMTREVVGGVAGAAMVEPVQLLGNEIGREEYTLEDSILNMAAVATIMPAAVGTAKALGRGTSNIINRKYGAQIDSKVTKDILIDGKKVDEAIIVKDIDNQLHSIPNKSELPEGDIRRNFEFFPINTMEDVKARPFYAPVKNVWMKGEPGVEGNIYGNFGKGRYMVDNPSIANNYAANSYLPVAENLAEIEISPTNLKNIDSGLDLEESIFVEEIAKEWGTKPGEITTWKQFYDELDSVYDTLPSDKAELIHSMVQDYHISRGHDGLMLRADDIESNVVVMFDRNGVNIKRTYSPDQGTVRKASQSEKQVQINRMNDPKSDVDYDPHHDPDTFLSQASREGFDTGDVELDSFLKDREALVDAELDAKEVLNPSIKEDIKKIRSVHGNKMKILDALEKFELCKLGEA